MAVFLSPIGNGAQYFTTGGLPLNGGFLNTYQAGTTTPQATFTTSAGNVANPVSIPLGVDGRPPAEIWLTVGAAYKFILTDSLGAQVGPTLDNISGAADNTVLAAATGAGLIGVTGGGTVQTSLDAKLPKAGGTMTGALNEAHGADIASAATINLDTATGNLVDVTGTNPISAVTLADGAQRVIRFTGILTFTNGASLILEGGANITTAPGDFAILRGYAGGVVRCVKYIRFNGRSVVAGIDFDGVGSTVATTTWTAATARGKVNYINNAGATTQTFPLASTFSSGQAVAFYNFGAGQATFTRQGSDGLIWPGSGTSFILNQNDAFIAFTDGSSWFILFLNGATGLVRKTWQNLTASRVSGTTYTNTSGVDIDISVECPTGGATASFIVGGNTINTINFAGLAGGQGWVGGPVPAGQTYSVTGTIAANGWWERRP